MAQVATEPIGMELHEHNDDLGDSTSAEVARFATMLALDDTERQVEAADELVSLVGREPRPDKTVLEELLTHPCALEGIAKVLSTGDDDARQTACNLLFLLSMSEPERPFDKSCTAQVENRKLIGKSPRVFQALLLTIDCGTPAVINSALNALMSISFDNAPNCLTIARTPGLVGVFLRLLAQRDAPDEARDGASGVLCNVVRPSKPPSYAHCGAARSPCRMRPDPDLASRGSCERESARGFSLALATPT